MNDKQEILSLYVNAGMSFIGFVICLNIIPKIGDMFIRANLFGIDMSKPNPCNGVKKKM